MSQIRKDLEDLTTQILVDNDLMYKAPIDVISLANLYDIKVYGIKTKNEISGAITYDKDEDYFEILVNTNNAKTRQRFTIAHELGHYFLHKEMLKDSNMHIDALYRTTTDMKNVDTKELEKEVDYFAGALLMNRELLEKLSKEYGIEELAKIFDVSTSAVIVRMKVLGLLC